jgi:hypothetical protein
MFNLHHLKIQPSIMEYSKIIAITGLPGLFELISSKSDGGIVRSLEDKSTRFVSSRVHQFSHLESIEVYTTRHNVNLVDILKAMESSKEKLPDDKDSSGLRTYFEKVYPELDFDRVYTSDLKKMAKWYAVLARNEVEIKLSEPVAEEEPPVAEAVEKEEKPAKKVPAVKSETKAVVKTIEDKKPAKITAEPKAAEKKAAPKKAAEKKEVPEKPAKKGDTKKADPKKSDPKAAKKSAAKPAAKKTAPKKK